MHSFQRSFIICKSTESHIRNELFRTMFIILCALFTSRRYNIDITKAKIRIHRHLIFSRSRPNIQQRTLKSLGNASINLKGFCRFLAKLEALLSVDFSILDATQLTAVDTCQPGRLHDAQQLIT